jgi:dephospho-CoA kinase
MTTVWGLTGGIACGKSTVARRLAERGAYVIDADALAREVVEPGTPGHGAVIAEFGDGILAADGSLDRAALGTIVFADATARARLEAILHPRIQMASLERIVAAGETDSPFVVYEAALLVETGQHRNFAGLIVVACDPATQLARLMTRDALNESAARTRIASQLPLESKVAVATHVIQNNASLSELLAATDVVFDKIVASLPSVE